MTLFSLIKSGTVRITSGRKILPKNEFCEILSAKEIIEKAHTDAKALGEENEKKCEELREQSKKEGRKEGLTEFNKHILYFESRVKEVETDFQNSVLPLALKAAKKIVGAQFALKPETIVDIVIKTLKPVSQNRKVKIIINPEDRKFIEEQKEEIRKGLDQLETLAIEERASVEPGGCIIETESGIINATLENQWRAIEAAFETFNKK
jgi:type III secretion protein L